MYDEGTGKEIARDSTMFEDFVKHLSLVQFLTIAANLNAGKTTPEGHSATTITDACGCKPLATILVRKQVANEKQSQMKCLVRVAHSKIKFNYAKTFLCHSSKAFFDLISYKSNAVNTF